LPFGGGSGGRTASQTPWKCSGVRDFEWHSGDTDEYNSFFLGAVLKKNKNKYSTLKLVYLWNYN